jgi:sulfane dehydrogenase subunit SoxC
MDSTKPEPKKPSRRKFLKSSAAVAGLAVSANVAAAAQTAMPAMPAAETPQQRAKELVAYGQRSKFVTSVRVPVAERDSPDMFGMTFHVLTPLQDSVGNVTPSALHFVGTHRGAIVPDIDPKDYRLLIHGMVDHPLEFTLADLKRFPSVSRFHFLECLGNRARPEYKTVQETHGLTSCSEWTGVPLSVLLGVCGVQKGAGWLVAEGADAGKWEHGLPMGKAMDDVIVAYGQNGEPLRPEQGYPLRLVVPGYMGLYNVKYLRHIKVADEPNSIGLLHDAVMRDDLGGKSRWYHYEWGPKSVITRPSAGLNIPGKGYVQITGLAWSGGGAVSKVDVSTDGGRTWREAKLQGPVLRKAHTRFTFDWDWNGQEAVIQSRCTDDQGEVQPSRAELYKNWGITAEDASKAPRTSHINAMQPWKVARDGSVHDAMFS